MSRDGHVTRVINLRARFLSRQFTARYDKFEFEDLDDDVNRVQP